MKKLILGLVLLLSSVSCDSCTMGPPDDNEIHVITSKAGKPLVWDRHLYPLKLAIDSRMPAPALEETIRAVSEWESIAQRDLFVINLTADEIALLNPAGGSLAISFAKLTEKPTGKHLGETRPYIVQGSTDRVHSATVEFDETVVQDRVLTYAVALHELGHALMITHDANKESIMYRDVTESLLVILPKHVKHVQDRYGPVLMP